MADFTSSTRAEPGNSWFEWSHSVENPQIVSHQVDGDGWGEMGELKVE